MTTRLPATEPETPRQMSLRLAFMGSPDFSVPALNALTDAGHDIARVYAQPPRPAGRGRGRRPGPVHARALELGLPVLTPRSLKTDEDRRVFEDLKLDVAVVVAYGLILPEPILEAPRFGCINVHASLLPRWRGAAPIQRAIEAGDAETGVTIMRMDKGLDTGDMLLTERLAITDRTTGGSLHDRLSDLGGRMIVETLGKLETGDLVPIPQPKVGVTYANKLDKAEGRIDWTRPAREIERKIRALAPWPGAWCEHGKDRLKIIAAKVETGAGEPGTVIDDRFLVACRDDAIRVTQAQRAGKAPMEAEDLLRGYPIAKGEILAQP